MELFASLFTISVKTLARDQAPLVQVMAKEYVDFDPKEGWLSGPELFYERQRYGTILPPMPEENIYCERFNMFGKS